MPFDDIQSAKPEPPKFPPAGMWTPTPSQCRKCTQRSCIGIGECCNECGLNEDGTKV